MLAQICSWSTILFFHVSFGMKIWACFFSIPRCYPFRILKSKKTQKNDGWFLLNYWIFDHSRLRREKRVCQRIVFCTFEAFKMLNGHHLSVKLKHAPIFQSKTHVEKLNQTSRTDMSPKSLWVLFLGHLLYNINRYIIDCIIYHSIHIYFKTFDNKLVIYKEPPG